MQSVRNNSFESWDILTEKLSPFQISEGITSFINPYSMLILRREPDVSKNVNNWYVDGVSLVFLINSFFKKKIRRYSFDDSSVAPVVFNFARSNNLPIAIIGTKQEALIKAVEVLKAKYCIDIKYYRDGFFKSQSEIEDTIKEIKKQNVKMVICGMGTPHQEKFLINLKNNNWLGYSYTCGGYLHQIAKKPYYYPSFFDKHNLRWVYRICDEPKLISRYLFKYPKFMFIFFCFLVKKNSK